MQTLVGAAEPPERPEPEGVRVTFHMADGTTTIANATHISFQPLSDFRPQEPYRTQAYVDKRLEITDGQDGA